MIEPISRDTAEHYTWPGAIGPQHCDGWHMHRSAGLSVIEERMPPGTAEGRHLHQHATQFFYVLSGRLTLEREGEIHTLAAGACCTVLAQTPHQVFNRGQEDVRFLVISEPPSHGDRVTLEAEARISGR